MNKIKKISVALTVLCMALSMTVAGAMADENDIIAIIDAMDTSAFAVVVENEMDTEEPLVQLSSDDFAVQETLPVNEPSTEAAVQSNTYRVTFYDFTGNVIGYQDVPEGTTIQDIDTVPMMSGISFAHWYNETDENKDAFALDSAVHGDINLYPYGTASDGGELGLGIIAGITPTVDEYQIDDVLNQILGAAAEPVLETQIPAIETEEVRPEESVVLDINQILGLSETEDTIDEAPAVETPAVQDGQLLTIDQILHTNENMTDETEAPVEIIEQDEAVENEIMTIDQLVEGVALEETDIEDEVIDAEEEFTIEDETVPLAGPAPSVEVVSDYAGALVAGTEVTVRAVIHNLPEQYKVSYQWQNDASGAYKDVAGATGESFTFHVGEFSEEGCNWRVNVDIFN